MKILSKDGLAYGDIPVFWADKRIEDKSWGIYAPGFVLWGPEDGELTKEQAQEIIACMVRHDEKFPGVAFRMNNALAFVEIDKSLDSVLHLKYDGLAPGEVRQL